MTRCLLVLALALACSSSPTIGGAPLDAGGPSPLDGGPLDVAIEAVAPAMDAGSDAVDAPVGEDSTVDVVARDGSLDVEPHYPAPDARVCDGLCPDAWAGPGCPCVTLEQMAAACPGYRCMITMDWKASGIGVGFNRKAEIRAADGHLCFVVGWARGWGALAPDGVGISAPLPDGGVSPVASYAGFDFPEHLVTHDLLCEGGTFTGVTDTECPSLVLFRICDAPEAGVP